MAFPHPQSGKDEYRNEDKPSSGGILWNVFKGTINIAEDRNGKDDVNPAKNRTFYALVHDVLDLRLPSRLRRPVGRFNAELFGVLGDQSLPCAELHGISAGDAAGGSSAEKTIKNIERNMPARGAPRDEAAIDAVPQPQASAAANRLEFPPHIAVLEHVGSVGARHFCFYRRKRPHPGEIHRSSECTQAPIDVEGCPLAQLRRIGKSLPNLFRRVA